MQDKSHGNDSKKFQASLEKHDVFFENSESSTNEMKIDDERNAAPYAGVGVTVASKVDAEAFTCEEPWACISISSAHSEWAEISTENRVALLQLEFSDISATYQSDLGRSFSQGDAVQILDFLAEHAPQINTLLIHCHFGESRSAGVAAAIAPLFGKAAADFEGNGMQPNTLVFQTLRESMVPAEEADGSNGLHEQLPSLDGWEAGTEDS